MLKQLGEIQYDVQTVMEDGDEVYEVRILPDRGGDFEEALFIMPQVYVSQFIDPQWKLWRVFAGDRRIISNLTYENERLLNAHLAEKVREAFSSKP